MGPQKLFIGGMILTLPVLPFLAWQGKRVKKRIPTLPEAGGPATGQVGSGDNKIRILGLGESTIAGVGVENLEQGMTVKMAEEIAEKTGRPVEWQVIAKSGYTAKRVRELLVPKIPTKSFDLILIGLGGNDTFTVNSPKQWRKDFKTLIQDIRKNQQQAKLVIANMPPIGEFPAFPGLMKGMLGNLARLHGKAIRDFPQLFSNLYFIDKRIRLEEWMKKVDGPKKVADFFSDGVHPSPLTYAIWGKEIAKFILEKKLV